MIHEKTIAEFKFYQFYQHEEFPKDKTYPDTFDIESTGKWLKKAVTKAEAIKMVEWISKAIERMD